MTKTALLAVCGAVALALAGDASAAPATSAQTPPPAQAQPAAQTATAPAQGQSATTAAPGQKIPDGGVPTFLRPETPEQRMARLGTAEDPGMDPDPTTVFYRFGKAFTIGKYDRYWAVYGGAHDENYIRPFGFVNSYRELYQQNEKWVWVWEPVPEPAAQQQQPAEDLRKSTQGIRRFTDPEIEFLQNIRPEFATLTVPSSGVTLRFENSSNGLPNVGSWRNNLALGDMNGDGFLDIVVPPERGIGINAAPAIFLGDGKGHWQYWKDVIWPHAIDYGGVAVADFNKDGKMDVVFAVHLQGIYVWLGDGKGGFTEVNEGLPRDFPTRRVMTADVDRDGYPDIVGLSEGPTAIGGVSATSARNKLRVYLNKKKGTSWEGLDVVSPTAKLGGDYLAAGNFNGDRYPDFVAGNVYQGSAETLYESDGLKKWNLVDPQLGKLVPYLSEYFALATGRFDTKKKTDDAIVSYVRFWPTDVNPKLIPTPALKSVTGIDRVSFGPGQPKRTPIVRWESNFGVGGLATGDFDGDGNLDIAYTNMKTPQERQIVVLLGDGAGNFKVAKTEGITTRPNATYDLKAADVNGDGRPDLVIMYEAEQATAFGARDGGIEVLLNRGPVAGAAASK